MCRRVSAWLGKSIRPDIKKQISCGVEAALGQLPIVFIMWQLTFYINLYKMMLGSMSFDTGIIKEK